MYTQVSKGIPATEAADTVTGGVALTTFSTTSLDTVCIPTPSLDFRQQHDVGQRIVRRPVFVRLTAPGVAHGNGMVVGRYAIDGDVMGMGASTVDGERVVVVTNTADRNGMAMPTRTIDT